MSFPLAEYFVSITVQGFNAVKAQLTQLKNQMPAVEPPKTLTERFKTAATEFRQFNRMLAPARQILGELANNAKLAAAAVAGISIAGIRIGSPGDYEKFTDAIQVLTAEVGLIFLPLFRQVTKVIEDAGTWVGTLSKQTKDLIQSWGKWVIGLGIVAGVGLSAVLVLGKIGAAIVYLNSALVLFGTSLPAIGRAIAVAFSTSPIALFLTALAAVVAALLLIKLTSDSLAEHQKKAFASLGGKYSMDDFNKQEFADRVKKETDRKKQIQMLDEEAQKAKADMEKKQQEYGSQMAGTQGLQSIGDYFGMTTKATELREAQNKAALAAGARDRLKRGESLDTGLGGDDRNTLQKRQAPQLIAITEAWRRVQTTMLDPVQQKLLEHNKMIAEESQKQTGFLQRIAERLKPDPLNNGVGINP